MRDNRLCVPVIGALISLAWLALWIWGRSPYGRYLAHHSLDENRGRALLVPVFLAGWTLMVVSMMLPTSLGVVALFHALTRQRQHPWLLMAMLIAGYLGVWVSFGILVYLGDLIIHESADRLAWLTAHSWLITVGILGVAGTYQFTPLKYRCLDRCRSPRSFVTAHWRGRREMLAALRLGVHHGLFCLGCCWSLMLLMFAFGVGSLGWMLALGAVMAIEKNASWGHRLSVPLGGVLLAAAGGLAALAIA